MSIKNIVGRVKELAFFEDILNSKDAEFVAVYGRRRVGKTHIIREYFGTKDVYFELTGQKDGSMHDQLHNFAVSYRNCFYPGLNFNVPKDWHTAFELLTTEIQKIPKNKKVIMFLDELPWLATKRSKLVQKLDHFWNTQWSRMNNLKLIVCGSAASWMLNNLINAKGGLYNRLTNNLLLQPFDLQQTREFLLSRNIKFTKKQILDIYIVTGGIPHYLKRIKKSKSAVQNINDMCFTSDGLLIDEFERLFSSLFDSAADHILIIKEIAKARYGIPVADLSARIAKKTGGTLKKKLDELEAAGFIKKFLPYGRKARDHYYRVIDEYTCFYLAWIDKYKKENIVDNKSNYWGLASQSPAWKNWAGYAFEIVCYKHLHKIKEALGLAQTLCKVGNWRHIPSKGSDYTGAQIDLLIDRDDGVISLCEMKHSDHLIHIDKSVAKNLLNKISAFESVSGTTKQVSLALVTTIGVKKNQWSEDLLDNVVTLDDLI